METIAPVNLIILFAIAASAALMFVLEMNAGKDSAARERQQKLKEYKEFFQV